MSYGSETYGGAPYGAESGGAASPGFTITPSAGHAAGTISIAVQYTGGAICPATMQISIQSGGGSVASWVQDTSGANGTGHFTFTEPAASGTPTVFLDAVTSTTQSFSNAAVAPNAPVIGTAVKGNASASVPYTESTDNGGASISGHTATSSPGGFTGTGASPITVSGLTNGTAYTFTVHSTNSVGNSPESSASNSVTPSTVPSAPTIGVAYAAPTTAYVPFTAGANGGSTTTSFTATSSPGGITGTLTQAGSGTITVTGLTNGQAYTFTVHATNANGNSAESSASNSVTPASYLPGTLNYVANASGVILNENFNPGSGWAGPNWSVVASPGYVAAPRSPIVACAPTPATSDAGTVREGHLLEDSDGQWWLFYGAGDGSVSGPGAPWRVHYQSSTNRGLTWTKHGATDFGLHKTSTPADGSYPTRDNLWIERRGATYYLHPMSGTDGGDGTPNAPYESDIFTAPTPSGPWTFVRRGAVVGAAGTFNENRNYMSAVILSGGVYYAFVAGFYSADTGSSPHRYTIGLGSGATPDGPFTPYALLPFGAQAGENIKPWFSTVLNKYAAFLNIDDPLVNLYADMNAITVGDSLTDWSQVTQDIVQHVSTNDGTFACGIASAFYAVESVAVQTALGYVPFTFDTDPNNGTTGIHYGRKLRYSVAEPSLNCAQYAPQTAVFSDTFDRSNRTINGDNGWTQPFGSFTIAILSNQLNLGSTSSADDRIAIQAGQSILNPDVSGTLTLGDSAGEGFIFRGQDTSNFYLVDISCNAHLLQVAYFKRVAGTYTQIGSNIFPGQVWLAGQSYPIRVTMIGTRISVYFGTVLVSSITDSTFTTAGFTGLRAGNTGATTRLVNNFVAKSYSTSVDRFAYTLANTNFIGEFSVRPELLATGAYWGLDYRIQGASGDSYRLVLTAAGGLVLRKSTGGSGGVPGTFSDIGTPSGSQVAKVGMAHRIRMSVAGNVHTAWLDGEQQISFTDSSSPYASGASIALVGTVACAQIRLLSLRSSNDVTVDGLTNGQTITLRAPGGVPLVTATVSGTSHTFTYTHFPAGSVEVDGSEFKPPAMIYGGDNFTVTAAPASGSGLSPLVGLTNGTGLSPLPGLSTTTGLS